MSPLNRTLRTAWTGENRCPSPELVALFAAGLLPDGGVALEVGCGLASDALLLSSLGFRVIAADRDRLQAKLARTRGRRTRLPLSPLVADATRLPLADQSCDVVLDRLVWNNVGAEKRATAYARELCRVVKPGGVLVVRQKLKWRRPNDAFTPVPWGALPDQKALKVLRTCFEAAGQPMPIKLYGDAGDDVQAVMLVFRGKDAAPSGRATSLRSPRAPTSRGTSPSAPRRRRRTAWPAP